MLYTVEGLCCICEDKDTGLLGAVAVVDKILYVAAVRKAGTTLLTSHLAVINDPGQGILKSISKAAGQDLVKKCADGDGAVVGEPSTRAFLMYEGGDGDIPVRR